MGWPRSRLETPATQAGRRHGAQLRNATRFVEQREAQQMATGPITQVSDIVTPSVFTPYVQQMTEVKSRLIQSGVLARDALADQLLAGGGVTFNLPSWRDLDDDADNVSGDGVADIIAASFESGTPTDANRLDATPVKIETDTEIAVRISRNQNWSSADLAAALAGADPMAAIGGRVASYWARRLQDVFIATMNGVIKDNTANDSGDYTYDISGSSYVAGVTTFSAEAFIDASTTLGDSEEDATIVMMHSTVLARAKKNNLIEMRPDSTNPDAAGIPFFLEKRVIVDDNLPVTSSVYDTWIFGAGAVKLGVGSPKVPTEVSRQALAGNGGGSEILHSRVEWCVHPVGHAYTGTAPSGGPSNAASTNNLNIATSWNRVYPQRKQVKFARLVTREA